MCIFLFYGFEFRLSFVVSSVKDFFSEEQTNNYEDMYKNFTGFIDTLNLSLLVKLDGKFSGAAKKPDAESSSSMNRYFYSGFRLLMRTYNLPSLTLNVRPIFCLSCCSFYLLLLPSVITSMCLFYFAE